MQNGHIWDAALAKRRAEQAAQIAKEADWAETKVSRAAKAFRALFGLSIEGGYYDSASGDVHFSMGGYTSIVFQGYREGWRVDWVCSECSETHSHPIVQVSDIGAFAEDTIEAHVCPEWGQVTKVPTPTDAFVDMLVARVVAEVRRMAEEDL